MLSGEPMKHALLPEVRSILAVRPNAIGDFMFALPALNSLRAAYPAARIVLLGKPWHAEFLRGRAGPVDEVRVMPPYPGIGAPPDIAPDPVRATTLLDALRAERFDLAIQMYGGGRYSNAFVREVGARLTIGASTPGAAALDRCIAYRTIASRRVELLQIVALAGAPPCFDAPELQVTPADRALAATVLPCVAGERIVVIHPGASDPRRRWPAERFAAVADALADQGATIVVSAGVNEAVLAAQVAAHMRHAPARLSGRLSLNALCGMLERACMMVSNDTGPLHMALAVGTPAVGIFWLTNLIEAAPLQAHLLSPALSLQARCPVCDVENVYARCPHDVCFVGDVRTETVTELSLELFAQQR
jgi:ADP-heptose:LPS heptosyltransferase